MTTRPLSITVAGLLIAATALAASDAAPTPTRSSDDQQIIQVIIRDEVARPPTRPFLISLKPSSVRALTRFAPPAPDDRAIEEAMDDFEKRRVSEEAVDHVLPAPLQPTALPRPELEAIWGDAVTFWREFRGRYGDKAIVALGHPGYDAKRETAVTMLDVSADANDAEIFFVVLRRTVNGWAISSSVLVAQS